MTGTASELATRELQDYWAVVERDDLGAAVALVVRLIDDGWSVSDVIEDLVTPTQHHVGRLWARDEWSVSREHAATALNEAVVRRIGTIRRSAQAKRGRPEVLVVCAESEWHALPALAVTALLNDQGISTVFLGADLPVPAVHHEAVRLDTQAVAVSASLASSLPYTRRLVDVIRSAHLPVVVGGAAFDPDGLRAAALGATAHAVRASELPDVIAALPARTVPPADHSSDAVREADQLTALRRELVSTTMAGLDPSTHEPWRDFVSEQLPHVLGALEAALLVNDPGVVSEAWEWFAEVLEHRGGENLNQRLRDSVSRAVREFPHASRMMTETAAC